MLKEESSMKIIFKILAAFNYIPNKNIHLAFWMQDKVQLLRCAVFRNHSTYDKYGS